MEVYMDNAATTQTYQEVVDAMNPFFTKHYGNASSLHSFGRKAHDALEKSRQNVSGLISADADEVIFTAGGTESDNIAIKGIAYKKKKGHIITSSIEHPAVLETCRYLEKQGFDVTYLGVDQFGMISLDELKEAIRDDTILITIMHANNEIGTIEP
ncbi:MAG: aminotransferase class V-fold PLP-dependent enzyme, partial [Halobacteriota archaeon]|nr:aminotransferase class V-fold PLP-dependent enzyme [Halobacteriota archaeon]